MLSGSCIFFTHFLNFLKFIREDINSGSDFPKLEKPRFKRGVKCPRASVSRASHWFQVLRLTVPNPVPPRVCFQCSLSLLGCVSPDFQGTPQRSVDVRQVTGPGKGGRRPGPRWRCTVSGGARAAVNVGFGSFALSRILALSLSGRWAATWTPPQTESASRNSCGCDLRAAVTVPARGPGGRRGRGRPAALCFSELGPVHVFLGWQSPPPHPPLPSPAGAPQTGSSKPRLLLSLVPSSLRGSSWGCSSCRCAGFLVGLAWRRLGSRARPPRQATKEHVCSRQEAPPGLQPKPANPGPSPAPQPGGVWPSRPSPSAPGNAPKCHPSVPSSLMLQRPQLQVSRLLSLRLSGRTCLSRFQRGFVPPPALPPSRESC